MYDFMDFVIYSKPRISRHSQNEDFYDDLEI
jgi:hypothetical protein